MITEVKRAVNFRQNLGEMQSNRRLQYRNDSIVINKDGKPVAALVDAELFARIRRMRDRFDALSNGSKEKLMPRCRSRKVWLRSMLGSAGTDELMAGLRVVLDTNVLVSGLAYPGSVPGRIVSIWCQGGLDVVLSRYISGWR